MDENIDDIYLYFTTDIQIRWRSSQNTVKLHLDFTVTVCFMALGLRGHRFDSRQLTVLIVEGISVLNV